MGEGMLLFCYICWNPFLVEYVYVATSDVGRVIGKMFFVCDCVSSYVPAFVTVW